MPRAIAPGRHPQVPGAIAQQRAHRHRPEARLGAEALPAVGAPPPQPGAARSHPQRAVGIRQQGIDGHRRIRLRRGSRFGHPALAAPARETGVGAGPERAVAVQGQDVGAAVGQALVGRLPGGGAVRARREADDPVAAGGPHGAVGGLQKIEVVRARRGAARGRRLDPARAQAGQAAAERPDPQRPVGRLVQGADVSIRHAGQPLRVQQGGALTLQAHQALGRPHPQLPIA